MPITPHLDNKKALFKWTVDLHNSVNVSQGKPKWSVEEALAYIKQLGERGRSPIITDTDFTEQHMTSFLKGIAYGIGGTAAIAVALFWLRGGRSSSD